MASGLLSERLMAASWARCSGAATPTAQHPFCLGGLRRPELWLPRPPALKRTDDFCDGGGYSRVPLGGAVRAVLAAVGVAPATTPGQSGSSAFLVDVRAKLPAWCGMGSMRARGSVTRYP